MSDLAELQTRLNYRFHDEALLRLALTHPSVAHERGPGTPHNQRLEFLGDAVLQLALTARLYEQFPHLEEGPLTKARAHLVNRRTLAEKGRHLHLGEHLYLSRGEELSGGRERPSALADAYEAVLGAIYLDGGFEAARAFVGAQFREQFAAMGRAPNLDNPKGELQELLQATSAEPPYYQLKSVSGPDHDRVFECSVCHQGVELGRGVGKSKKEAESRAAQQALEHLRQPPASEPQ